MLTIHTRRKLIASLAIIFVVSAAVSILYIQGWRFDVQKFSLDKVGAIYVRSYPQDAAIKINGKPAQNGSWFFSRGTFISDLFPKNYRVDLSEPGYLPWHETVTVAPSLVAELSNAVLVPAKALPLALTGSTSSIADFWPRSNTPLILTEGNSLAWGVQKVSGVRPIGAGESNTYLVTADATNAAYYIHNFATGTNVNLRTLLKKFGIDPARVSIMQYQDKIVIAHATGIFLWDIRKLALHNAGAEEASIPAKKISETVGATYDPMTAHIAVSQFFIAWSARKGANSVIAVYDPFLEKLVSTSPTVSGHNEELSWNARGVLGIREDDGNLFSFDPSSGVLTQIASDVVSFSWDASGENVATLEHSALEIFLAGTDDNYYRFRLPDMSAFTHTIWYGDRAHLFLVGADRVDFLDVKDSTLENLVIISNAHNAAYDPTSNTLYFLRDGNIMTMAFPN